ncbi:IclR family transcriptional regulator [Palleronia aestuarii]|uniref:IclR family transcriptional regulator n=1 Tax=Palleronia aestuarii TaxID=568105 RepID=A0A2W7NB79_9RHOB|nr:IclR family transcriptional regulator [Palleronia aestuarii]PZX10266.1 IclR family transcriptional regulator [Palleronia aestuarii]
MTEAKGVEAVDRALQILDCFTPGETDLSLAELARKSGFYKSTIIRLAVSLEKFGYLIRGDSGRYRLGPTTWRLGAHYRRCFDLAGIMRPELKLLSDATQETASYYVREGESRICLFRSEPARSIRHSITEGASMPLMQGASGKILLAYSGDQSEGDSTIRKLGFAISLGERDAEVAAIAMPVLSRGGRLMGAIAVSGLITRFGEDRHPELTAALAEAQKRLVDQITV